VPPRGVSCPRAEIPAESRCWPRGRSEALATPESAVRRSGSASPLYRDEQGSPVRPFAALARAVPYLKLTAGLAVALERWTSCISGRRILRFITVRLVQRVRCLEPLRPRQFVINGGLEPAIGGLRVSSPLPQHLVELHEQDFQRLWGLRMVARPARMPPNACPVQKSPRTRTCAAQNVSMCCTLKTVTTGRKQRRPVAAREATRVLNAWTR
jgi:hypothetical protein